MRCIPNNTSDTEDLTNVDVTNESVATTTTTMSDGDDEIWHDANEEYDAWYEVAETIGNYQE